MTKNSVHLREELSPKSSAEEIFSGMDGIEVSSAGTGVEAECQVSADLLEWADRVSVMEQL
jgi:predicted protein tyrosine phosphatase